MNFIASILIVLAGYGVLGAGSICLFIAVDKGFTWQNIVEEYHKDPGAFILGFWLPGPLMLLGCFGIVIYKLLHRDKEANVARWRNSGLPKRWVDEHHYSWDHRDWLRLLKDLRASKYWPMDPDKVGEVIEEIKQRGQATVPSDPVNDYVAKLPPGQYEEMPRGNTVAKHPINVIVHDVRAIELGLVDFEISDEDSQSIFAALKMLNPEFADAISKAGSNIQFGGFYEKTMDALVQVAMKRSETKYPDCDVVIQTSRFELMRRSSKSWSSVNGLLVTYQKNAGAERVIAAGGNYVLLPI